MNLAAAIAQVAPNWRHPIGEVLNQIIRGRLTYFVYLAADIVTIIESLAPQFSAGRNLHKLRRDRGSYLAMAPAAAVARIAQLVAGPHPHIHHMRRDYPSLERLQITGRARAPPRYHHDGPECYVIVDVSTEHARHTTICCFNYDNWRNGLGFSRKEFEVHGYIDYWGDNIISVWHLPAGIRAYYDCAGRRIDDDTLRVDRHVQVRHYPLECGWHLRRSESITSVKYCLMDFRGNSIEIVPEPIFDTLFFTTIDPQRHKKSHARHRRGHARHRRGCARRLPRLAIAAGAIHPARARPRYVSRVRPARHRGTDRSLPILGAAAAGDTAPAPGASGAAAPVPRCPRWRTPRVPS